MGSLRSQGFTVPHGPSEVKHSTFHVKQDRSQVRLYEWGASSRRAAPRYPSRNGPSSLHSQEISRRSRPFARDLAASPRRQWHPFPRLARGCRDRYDQHRPSSQQGEAALGQFWRRPEQPGHRSIERSSRSRPPSNVFDRRMLHNDPFREARSRHRHLCQLTAPLTRIYEHPTRARQLPRQKNSENACPRAAINEAAGRRPAPLVKDVAGRVQAQCMERGGANGPSRPSRPPSLIQAYEQLGVYLGK